MPDAVLNLLKHAVTLRETAAFTRRLAVMAGDCAVEDRLMHHAIELEYQADLMMSRATLLRERATRTREIAAELKALVEESHALLKKSREASRDDPPRDRR